MSFTIQNNVQGTPVAIKPLLLIMLTLGFFMTLKNTLDLRGVISPLNLLKCKSRLKSMAEGDILKVLLADLDVAQDLMTIVKRSTDEIVHTQKKSDYICLGIKKGPRNYNDS